MMQLIVGTIITLVVSGGIYQAMSSGWNLHKFSINMPWVQEDARRTAIRLANSLRRASQCISLDQGCTVDAVVENATPTGITTYGRSKTGVLTKTIYSSTTDTDGNSSGYTLSYYQASAYHSGSLTPYTPSSTTTKQMCAVGITATVTRDGLTGTYTTLVRLRNSPKKTTPGD